MILHGLRHVVWVTLIVAEYMNLFTFTVLKWKKVSQCANETCWTYLVKRWSPTLNLQTSCCRSWILPNNSICALSANCVFPTMPKNFELIKCFVSSTPFSPSRRDLCVKSWIFSFLSYTIISFMTLHRWSQLSSQQFGKKFKLSLRVSVWTRW